MSDVLARLTTALSDRYRVDRELGAGGMATVYLAHDLRHEREVAIKVLHPDLGAALGADRFLAEIKTTAAAAALRAPQGQRSPASDPYAWTQSSSESIPLAPQYRRSRTSRDHVPQRTTASSTLV